MWLGNSERVAEQHYLQLLDAHFEKAAKSAVRNPVQLASALARTAPHDCTTNAKTLEKPRVLAKKMGDTGFDSPSNSTGNVGVGGESGAHSGARGDADAILADHDDPRLLGLIDAWQTLADDVKVEMLTLAGIRPDDVDDVNQAVVGSRDRMPFKTCCGTAPPMREI